MGNSMTGLNVGAVFSMLPRHLLDGCTEKWGEGFVIVEDDLRNKNPVGVGDGNFALDTGLENSRKPRKTSHFRRSVKNRSVTGFLAVWLPHWLPAAGQILTPPKQPDSVTVSGQAHPRLRLLFLRRRSTRNKTSMYSALSI